MRISSRFTALALALCLALALLPGAALAAETTVSDWSALTTAISNAASGDVIIISGEITTTGATAIEITGKSVTIQGTNGGKITTGITDLFTVGSGGTLTLGAGLTVESTSSILWAKEGGTIIVNGADLNSTSSDYVAALAEGGGKITIESGTIHSENESALGATKGGTASIDGGTVSTNTTGNRAAAYAVGSGSLLVISDGTVSGASFTSATVGCSSGATLEIKGGTISGSGIDGAVNSGDTTEKGTNITISGNAVIQGIIGNVDSVTGGTFTEDPSAFVDDASNIPTAAVSDDAGTPTYVVGETQIEKAAKDIADAGGSPKVDVKEGSADLDLPTGTTVSNSGSGDVKANGQDVSPGTPIVIQPAPAPGPGPGPVNPPSSGGSSGGSGNAATYRGNGRFSTTASGITRVKVDGQAVGFTAESGGFRLDTVGLTKGKHLITVEWGNSSFTTWFTYEGGVTMSVDMEIPKTGGAPMLAYAALALTAAAGMLRRR